MLKKSKIKTHTQFKKNKIQNIQQNQNKIENLIKNIKKFDENSSLEEE
jgi:hypothetical protein